MPFFELNGLRLHYRLRGSGPLLILLPGNTASSALHRSELDHFGRAYTAAALDLPGTGLSQRIDVWPDDWFGLGAQAAAALVEHLGEQQAVLVGTSGGAIVALTCAARYPERVRAVIADSDVPYYPPDLFQHELANRAQRTPDQARFWKLAHGDDWDAVVTADSDMLARIGSRAGGWLLPESALADIHCPVLLTGTLDDTLLPPDHAEQALQMLARIPTARLYLTRGGDHPLMWSKPAEFRAAAGMFLAGLEPGGQP